MFAIFKREVKSYFLNPVGYVFFSLFFSISGLMFFLNNIKIGVADVSGFFSSLFLICVFSIPIITMGVFSDEFKLNTEKLLFSCPLTNFSVVFGKFFSSLVVYLIALSINLIYVLVLSFFSNLQFSLILGCFLGIIFLGAALISIGVFVSSLTKNSVVSAFLTFAVFIFFTLIGEIGKNIPFVWLQKFLSSVVIMTRYNNFVMGIVNITDIFYFVSIVAVFLFSTIMLLLKKQWS